MIKTVRGRIEDVAAGNISIPGVPDTIRESTRSEHRRYPFDHVLGRTNDWAQVDTRDDSPWYGCWTSPTLRAIVEYAEKDITVTSCTTADEYRTALRRAVGRMQEAGKFKHIDSGLDALDAEFRRLGCGDLLHPRTGEEAG